MPQRPHRVSASCPISPPRNCTAQANKGNARGRGGGYTITLRALLGCGNNKIKAGSIYKGHMIYTCIFNRRTPSGQRKLAIKYPRIVFRTGGEIYENIAHCGSARTARRVDTRRRCVRPDTGDDIRSHCARVPPPLALNGVCVTQYAFTPHSYPPALHHP